MSRTVTKQGIRSARKTRVTRQPSSKQRISLAVGVLAAISAFAGQSANAEAKPEEKPKPKDDGLFPTGEVTPEPYEVPSTKIFYYGDHHSGLPAMSTKNWESLLKEVEKIAKPNDSIFLHDTVHYSNYELEPLTPAELHEILAGIAADIPKIQSTSSFSPPKVVKYTTERTDFSDKPDPVTEFFSEMKDKVEKVKPTPPRMIEAKVKKNRGFGTAFTFAKGLRNARQIQIILTHENGNESELWFEFGWVDPTGRFEIKLKDGKYKMPGGWSYSEVYLSIKSYLRKEKAFNPKEADEVTSKLMQEVSKDIYPRAGRSWKK